MKILVMSDGHGKLSMLSKLENIAKKVDLVFYAGDFAEMYKSETSLPFMNKLITLHDEIFSVTGNCDEKEFRETLEKADISVEGLLVYYNGLVITGSGGGSQFTGTTPNERTDDDMQSDLHLVEESIPAESSGNIDSWNNLIVISHNPPKDTALDITGSGFHVGSPLLRTFIETYKPLLVVSGHIHESRSVDSIGDTALVNPGPLEDGYYAIVEITGGKTQPFKVASIELCSL